jgi:hypothetical protein
MSSISQKSSIEESKFLFFDFMPDDLLKPIFSCLPQIARNNCRLVCKRFLDKVDIDNRVADLVIETFFSKTKPFCILYQKGEPFPSYDWNFTKLSSQLKVAVRVLDFTKNGLSVKILSQDIAIQFPNITKIKVKLEEGCFTISQKQLYPLQWFSSVKSLELFGSSHSKLQQYEEPTALSLLPSSIEHLEFTDINFEEIHFQQLSRFTALKSLVIDNYDLIIEGGHGDCGTISSETCSHLSPTLEKLKLYNNAINDMRGISHLTNLKTLYIDRLEYSGGLDKIPQNVTCLGGYIITLKELRMLTHLTNLEKFIEVDDFSENPGSRSLQEEELLHLGVPQWMASLCQKAIDKK